MIDWSIVEVVGLTLSLLETVEEEGRSKESKKSDNPDDDTSRDGCGIWFTRVFLGINTTRILRIRRWCYNNCFSACFCGGNGSIGRAIRIRGRRSWWASCRRPRGYRRLIRRIDEVDGVCILSTTYITVRRKNWIGGQRNLHMSWGKPSQLTLHLSFDTLSESDGSSSPHRQVDPLCKPKTLLPFSLQWSWHHPELWYVYFVL